MRIFLLDKFKVLIVLARRPVATPLEASLDEEFVAEVVVVYPVGEVPVTVAIVRGCGGLHVACAVFAVFVVGIVEGVDVDRQSTGMLRQLGGAADGAVAEAR